MYARPADAAPIRPRFAEGANARHAAATGPFPPPVARELSTQHMADELGRMHAEVDRLREALEQRERDHLSLLSEFREVVWESDAHGRLIWLSPAWTTLTGAPPEDSLGHLLLSKIHPGDQSVLCAFLNQLSTGEPHAAQIQVRYPRADGGYYWAELRARLLTDSEGAPLGFRGTLLDVSDRKQMETALDISESRFRAVFERGAAGILLLLPDRRTLAANPAALRMLGCSELELRRRSLFDLFTPQEHPSRHTALVDLLAGKREAARLEVRLLRRQARDLEMDLQANLVRDEDGQPLFAVVLLNDITQARRTEEALVKAKQRAEEVAAFKSALLDNVGHELRTPLATIMGFASILTEEVAEEQREFMRMIQQAGERLMDTLDGVMDLAHLEAGEMVPRPELLHVQAELQDLAAKLTPAAREKVLTLSVDAPQEPVFVNGDRGFFHRVFKHLIGNAVKFTSDGGVRVHVEADENDVRVHVQDTGAGIGEGFLSELFETFSQESSGVARLHDGVGLGLTVTRRMVELMGGRISVESRKGTGSTFTVAFPRLT